MSRYVVGSSMKTVWVSWARIRLGVLWRVSTTRTGRLVICRPCRDLLREMALYCWEAGGQGREVPLKQNDHAMDDMRYFASTVAGSFRGDGFAAVSVER